MSLTLPFDGLYECDSTRLIFCVLSPSYMHVFREVCFREFDSISVSLWIFHFPINYEKLRIKKLVPKSVRIFIA